MGRLSFQYVPVGLVIFLLSVNAFSQIAGSLDLTFGSGGTVTTNLNVTATLYDMAIQPDKKIVVVGYTMDPTIVQSVGMIARFKEDGTLDTTFDGNGFNNANFMKSANAVEILAGGKILVGGYSFNNHFCIARFNPNGSLDTSFDGAGIVYTTVGSSSSISSIQVLSNGKILAVGRTRLTGNSNPDIAMVKYNADGSLDTSFGSGGRVATDFGSEEFANDCAIQADGKIIVAGSYLDPLPNLRLAAVIRYSADGLVDTTFGNNGKVFRSASTPEGATEVAIQSDGKVIIVGSGIPPVRYNSNGTYDVDFDTPAWAFTSTLAIQSNGKIIVGGGDTPNTPAIVRYNVDGTPDNSFGTEGVVTTSFFASAILIAPDGKIVVGGTPPNSIGLTRYLNDVTGQVAWLDFDGDDKTDIGIFRPGPGEWWYQRSSDLQVPAFQFGAGTDRIAPADFTGDGKTDVAFWRPSSGEWFVLRSEDNSFFAFPFGASGDVPVAGDYDGDGRTDAAVFRPSSATWFANRSTAGVSIQQFGLTTDQPIPSAFVP